MSVRSIITYVQVTEPSYAPVSAIWVNPCSKSVLKMTNNGWQPFGGQIVWLDDCCRFISTEGEVEVPEPPPIITETGWSIVLLISGGVEEKYYTVVAIDDGIYAFGYTSSQGGNRKALVSLFDKYTAELLTSRYDISHTTGYFLDSKHYGFIYMGGLTDMNSGVPNSYMVKLDPESLAPISQVVLDGEVFKNYVTSFCSDGQYLYVFSSTLSYSEVYTDILVFKLSLDNMKTVGRLRRLIMSSNGNDEVLSSGYDSDTSRLYAVGYCRSKQISTSYPALFVKLYSDLSVDRIYGFYRPDSESVFTSIYVDSRYLYVAGYYVNRTTGKRYGLLMVIDKTSFIVLSSSVLYHDDYDVQINQIHVTVDRIYLVGTVRESLVDGGLLVVLDKTTQQLQNCIRLYHSSKHTYFADIDILGDLLYIVGSFDYQSLLIKLLPDIPSGVFTDPETNVTWSSFDIKIQPAGLARVDLTAEYQYTIPNSDWVDLVELYDVVDFETSTILYEV